MFNPFKNFFKNKTVQTPGISPRPIASSAVEATDIPEAPSLTPRAEILDVPRTTHHASFPLEPDNKRNGKIAKLPRPLRDQINRALDAGQSAVSIARGLNE